MWYKCECLHYFVMNYNYYEKYNLLKQEICLLNVYKLIMHLFLNNINVINKCMHTFDISIVIYTKKIYF